VQHCCHGRAISITYSECVSVTEGYPPCWIDICGLSGLTVFFHIIVQMAQFSDKKLLNTKCVFWFSLQILSETFPILRGTERDLTINVHRLYVQDLLFLSDLNDTWYSWQIFEKHSNIKFH